MALVPPISLDSTLKRPLHRQLEDQIRKAILVGQLRPGVRLPSIRELAGQYGIAKITVRTAYDQLAAEGYLCARAGSGTSVTTDLPDDLLQAASRPPRLSSGRDAVQRSAARETRLPSGRGGLPLTTYVSERPSPGSLPYDFRPARPGLDLFPTILWEKLLRGAWRELTSGDRAAGLDYGDPAGNRELRSALMIYLAASRAVRTSGEQIVITSGSQAAFDAASRLWLGRGRTCAVEDPGYPMVWRALSASGTTILPVPVDDHGLVTQRLPPAAQGVFLTPSWQYPAGGTLPVGRRVELLRWAHEANALVIEDDYDSELRYEGRPLASLQGIDDEDRVLYVGTLSKVAFPGLRLGYAIVPHDMVGRFLATLELTQRGASAVEQLAAARFIEGGHFERHLRRLRLVYAERQSILVAAIRRVFGSELIVAPAPAGMHLVARLTDSSITATDLAIAARRHGVGITPMSTKRLVGGDDSQLLLGYAGAEPSEIRSGIERLSVSYRTLRNQLGLKSAAQDQGSGGSGTTDARIGSEVGERMASLGNRSSPPQRWVSARPRAREPRR